MSLWKERGSRKAGGSSSPMKSETLRLVKFKYFFAFLGIHVSSIQTSLSKTVNAYYI